MPASDFPWSRVFGRVNLPAKKHEMYLKGPAISRRCLRLPFHDLVFFGRVNLPAKKHEMY
jgi:hypothetical protein